MVLSNNPNFLDDMSDSLLLASPALWRRILVVSSAVIAEITNTRIRTLDEIMAVVLVVEIEEIN
jgi:hypothetical protein